MPLYLYEHPKTKKVIEILQTMKEDHVYTDSKGESWNRIFTSPNATIDGKIDPFSESAFVSKLGATKGSMGDAFDRSREMSDKRAEKNGGIDPVRCEYYKNYSKKRKGKAHPDIAKSAMAAGFQI